MANITPGGYSGLFDGVHSGGMVNIADPRPPLSGVVNVLAQKRGMFGQVEGFGGNRPQTREQIDPTDGDLTVRGGYDYALRQEDAGNQVTITNADRGGDRSLSAVPTVPTSTAQETKRTIDTHMNRLYGKDLAETGATSPADVPDRYSDGT